MHFETKKGKRYIFVLIKRKKKLQSLVEISSLQLVCTQLNISVVKKCNYSEMIKFNYRTVYV